MLIASIDFYGWCASRAGLAPDIFVQHLTLCARATARPNISSCAERIYPEGFVWVGVWVCRLPNANVLCGQEE
jgi:hypothetical protein